MMKINKILTDEDRERLDKTVLPVFREYAQDVLNRKITTANVQQEFVYEQLMNRAATKDNRILSVGCYEDTCYEALRNQNYNIIGIDPVINMDLHTFKQTNSEKFDFIFSTSVIEHVKDDEQFIKDICSLLKSGGIAILTCDYKKDYKLGDRLPTTDVRLYTEKDLLQRLYVLLVDGDCDLIDVPDYSESSNFAWEGVWYNFATYVFVKNYD